MVNSFHANAGIRDSDLLITKENIGALIHDFHEPDFAEAAARIELLMNDVAQTRAGRGRLRSNYLTCARWALSDTQPWVKRFWVEQITE